MMKKKNNLVLIYSIIMIVGVLFVFWTPYYVSHYFSSAIDTSNEVILDIFAKGRTYFGFLLIIIGVSGLFLERYSTKNNSD